MAADRRRAVFPIILLQSREPHRAEEHMRKTADRRMSRRDGGADLSSFTRNEIPELSRLFQGGKNSAFLNMPGACRFRPGLRCVFSFLRPSAFSASMA